MADWGVLVSEPQRHRLVADGLAACSVEYFMPMVESMTVVRGRHYRSKYPLFGRYMLVVIDQGWRALQFIRGVSGIMLEPEPRDMVNGEFIDPLNDRLVPALVDERDIERIRSECVGNVWQDPKNVVQTDSFIYGQRVTPKSGPFANHVGSYDCSTRKGSDAAFFKLFGVERRMIFKRGELTAV